MTSPARVAPPVASAEPSAAMRYIADTGTIAGVEIRKVLRDPTELLTRALQPLLWLLVFGQVLARARAIPTGALSYLDFLAPGVLAQSALFSAIFYGIAVIWERDLGTIHKLFVSPTPRGALVLGKGVSAGARSLSQVAIVYTLALVLGVRMNPNPLALAGVAAAVLIGACCFATLSLIIAALVKTRERFMGIGQVLTMPLFFASNAIYPLAIMPPWLHAIARFNPLSYEVDALRALMIAGGVSAFGLGMDFGVLLATTTVLVLLAARIYPRVVT